jgi:hypothetical protein
MELLDYSGRDENVRRNIYASVRRREGLPHELFTAYWRDVHGPLCSRLPGLGFYVQQHFDRNHGANLWPAAEGVRRITAPLDGSAELGFASPEDQAVFAEAGTILYGDEANFIGEAVAYTLPTGSRTLVDREEDGTRNGADLLHRVHVYMSRKSGADANAWLTETGREFAKDPAIRKLKLHLAEPYDNEHPAPPSPNVDHLVDPDRLDLAVAEVAFVSARTAREFFEGARFRKTLREQSRYLNALGAYLVTGFYTFMRDGRPTPAGIRGSRQAELIDKVGAANQLHSAVTRLFRASAA